tara:strand:+ start:1159 stop:1269 length:111 start_codon:yes stop_codon:yes gene_type:complete
MPSLEQIKNQIKSLDGMSKFLGKKEIKESFSNVILD